MIPDLLIDPTVGFMPTIELREEGERIDPDVSVPNATGAKFDAIATPLPELDPPDSNTLRPYGFNVCPPIALYPRGQPEQK